MVTLEQIRLLNSRITQAIGSYIRVKEENAHLRKQIEEFRESATKLQEENSKVEAEFTSALEKLNRFEEAFEEAIGQSLSSVKTGSNQGQSFRQEPAAPAVPAPEVPGPVPEVQAPAAPLAYMIDEEDIPEVTEDMEEPEDIEDTDSSAEESGTEDSDGAELDIF
jgi:chromosome segregation ATPase